MAEIERRRKKPLPIEVLVWDGTNFGQVDGFAGDDGQGNRNARLFGAGLEVWNEQDQAWLVVTLGHRVAKGALGELYPMSEEAFEVTTGPADAAPSGTEFAVFWGGPDPDDCAGWELKDDEAEAEEDAQWRVTGGVARREVSRGPWTVTVAPEPCGEVPGA
jgi:hypothetical protein